MRKNNKELIEIYNGWKIRSIKEGFTFDQFWGKVNFYIDPMDATATDYATVGKIAYESLIFDRQFDINSHYSTQSI